MLVEYTFSQVEIPSGETFENSDQFMNILNLGLVMFLVLL
jgi:hypothetical protein